MNDIISFSYAQKGITYLKLLYKKIEASYINRITQNITNSNKQDSYNICDYSFKYSYINEHKVIIQITITIPKYYKIRYKKYFKKLYSFRQQIKPQINTNIIRLPAIIKPKFDIPAPLLRLTRWQNNYHDYHDKLIIQDKPINPIITIINNVVKTVIPGKPKKAKNHDPNRQPNFITLTKEDITDIKRLLGANIFKNLTSMQLAYLKTNAIKRGIDDWISLVDAHLSYDENKHNFDKLFGSINSDNELMIKYEKCEGMRNDAIYNMMPDIGEMRI